MTQFYTLYDELNGLIKSDTELASLLGKHISGKNRYYSDLELKTLTVDIGHYIGRYLEEKNFAKVESVQNENPSIDQSHDDIQEVSDNNPRNYWWLVAKPSIWSLYDMAIDEVQSYTLYNDNGRQRRIFKNFQNAKAGDVVLGYEATPTKQIIALLEIAKENDGKELFFRKKEAFANPVDYATFKDINELSEMEFLKNKNGSFFNLTEDEFNVLIDIIREDNPIVKQKDFETYDDDTFLKEVYMNKEDLSTKRRIKSRNCSIPPELFV